MADYLVARAQHATLAAATVDHVKFTVDARPERHYVIHITNLDASDPIYARFDADPTVAGDETYCIHAGVAREFEMFARPVYSVGLIASGTAEYNVEATL